MFKKCLKYDLRAFRKIWLLAAGIALLLGAICSIGIGLFTFSVIYEAYTESVTEVYKPGILFYTQMFLGAICAMLMTAASLVMVLGTSIGNYVRYYTHLFTDQGYLTFTLPVKRSTIFWSKTVSAYLYNLGAITVTSIMSILSALGVACGIVAGVFYVGMMQTGMTLLQLIQTFDVQAFIELWDVCKNWIVNGLGMINVFRILFVTLLLGVVYLAADFASIMTGYFCITIGATLFRKLKLLGALVCYYVVNNVLAVPAVYFGTYYFMFAGMLGTIAIPQLFENVHIGMSVVYLILVIMAVMFVTIGLAMAYFSIWRLDKKLNLA